MESSIDALQQHGKCYRVWHTGPGELYIEVRALGTAVLVPSLAIVAPVGETALPRTSEGDCVRFHLSALQVEALRNAPTLRRPPYLGFLCDAFMSTERQRRTWGWAIRFSRENCILPCLHPDGRVVRADRDGFVRSGLRSLPPGAGIARAHAIMSLS